MIRRLCGLVRLRGRDVRCCVFVIVVGLMVVVIMPERAEAWENMLEDPGFENYRLDRRGFYKPGPDSRWIEVAMGRGSMQLDMNGWEAPPQMVRERPLRFTPGTTGYEQEGPEQNTGRLILQQDVVFGKDGFRLMNAAVDDFFLAPSRKP